MVLSMGKVMEVLVLVGSDRFGLVRGLKAATIHIKDMEIKKGVRLLAFRLRMSKAVPDVEVLW